MTEPAITVQGLGKKYSLRHLGDNRGMRHILQDTLSLKWLRQEQSQPVATNHREDFWALHDVSFDVQPGEVLGIIGRNGAGKSTLLKILSRITEPTTGEIRINGRVASLLEVGTGFHYELTGRENIYLNGTILGMTRREIKKKFDEIIAFAEVEKFLDTPVKHYSSGMFVRLAFSVAAHLEPEILIIDEVLAVGDAQFQKKCLGKMEDVAKREGRTVLFVSHNMTAVSSLTSRVILLRKGGVEYSGTPQQGIQLYMENDAGPQDQIFTAEPSLDTPKIVRTEIVCSGPGQTHESGQPWKARIQINFPKDAPKACVSFQLVNQYETPVLHFIAYDQQVEVGGKKGIFDIECSVPSLNLNVGVYYLRVWLSEPSGPTIDTADNVCPFEVVILNRMSTFGWRPSVCTHFEACTWSVE